MADAETTIVVRTRELDLSNADAVMSSVAAEAVSIQAPRVVLSLHQVEFLDAYAIGKLIALRTELARTGRSLRLGDVNSEPRRVLILTGLLDTLTTAS